MQVSKKSIEKLNIFLKGTFGSPIKGEVGVISAMELREIRAKTEKGLQQDAIIISENDLKILREKIVIKSP